MRKVAFLPRGFDEFNLWAVEDKKNYAKIVLLVISTSCNKPGRLKPQLHKQSLPSQTKRRLLTNPRRRVLFV